MLKPLITFNFFLRKWGYYSDKRLYFGGYYCSLCFRDLFYPCTFLYLRNSGFQDVHNFCILELWYQHFYFIQQLALISIYSDCIHYYLLFYFATTQR